MRIAMLTGEYPPAEGGVGAFTHQLGLALGAAHHDVHILTSGNGGTSSEEGLIVHREVERWNLHGLVEARRHLRRIAPDITNLQYEPAAYGMRGAITLAAEILMAGSRCPLVVTYHDLLPPYLFPKAGPLRQRSVWHLARNADGAIATNREDSLVLGEELARSKVPVRLIPIGSNISAAPPLDFDRDQWRAARGYAPSDLVVGFFGFLNRTKGIETLLDAVSRLGLGGLPVQLLFIGGRTGTSDVTNAAYADEVDHLIAALGLNPRIQWTGFAAPEEVSAALKSIDVCALPYREGANLRHGTLHAALVHGCAIVTTRSATPVEELEATGAVALVPPDDSDALADTLRVLAGDVARRQAMGRRAEQLAQRFTWPAIAAETAAFFSDLLRNA